MDSLKKLFGKKPAGTTADKRLSGGGPNPKKPGGGLEQRQKAQGRPPASGTVLSDRSPELTALQMAEKKDWQVKPVKLWRTGEVMLDTYQVEDRKAGGMGYVYIAEHLKWKVKMAIKAPNEMMLSDPSFYARVLREAGNWIDLGLHPHIAYCYYVRRIEDVPHIFIEYVDGGSLREWIADRRCYDLKVGLDLAIQFCHGMEYAHKFGMIHRDIKPENVLMSQDGLLKITDFGIARTNETADSRLPSPVGGQPARARGVEGTMVGARMGSLSHMSPEQWEDPHGVDQRADIYSFGVCLYEMFCGRKPYDSASHIPASVVAKLEKRKPHEPARLRADIPTEVAHLLKKCCALEREGRYASFEAVRQELIRIYRGLFHQDPPHTKVETIKQRADALNNLGVSAWDLGREPDALQRWHEALKQDPQHLEATFNLSYAQWRKGEIQGKNLVTQMEELKSVHEKNPAYWECLAWIQLEQMNISEVQKIQNSEYRVKDKGFRRELQELLQELKERAKPWRRFMSWMGVTKTSANGPISTGDWRRSHPHPLLCKVRTVASLSKVTDLLRLARASIEKGALEEAREFLREARLVPGYEEDEEIGKVEALWRKERVRTLLQTARASIEKGAIEEADQCLKEARSVPGYEEDEESRKVSVQLFEMKLVPYEFEEVRLNATGGVVERKRRQARSYTEDLGGGVKLEMVAIPDGTFEMGSPSTEADRSSDEGPVHKVTVSSFYIGKYPVTQAQWRAVARLPKVKLDLNPEPSRFKGDDLPVEQVSWHEAVEFCERLSQKMGAKYRLPSEAEWEYACRAGTKTPFHFGETITPEYVNYDGNYPYGQARKGEYRKRTTPVGSLGVANGFGLYDMHGNVWEWCQDMWHNNYQGAPGDGSAWEDGSGSHRVFRGGGWLNVAQYCRSANRFRYPPDDRYNGLGFRLVRTAW